MKEPTDNRRPEEIESDIERTRADFSSTIEAIQHKLRPDELKSQAVDYALNTKPGAIGVNLVNTVRENPVPVMMIGIGVAWLMRARRYSSTYMTGGRRQRFVERSPYYPAVDTMGYDSTYGADYRSTETSTSGTSDGMLHRAASKMSETGSDIKAKADEMGQRLSDTASSMTGRAREISESARGRLHESAEQTRARMNELSQRSQEQYYRARDRASQMMDEQPLLVGAIGLAIGAALGGSLPSTRRENELMGSTRDDLLGRAKETVREQAESVKQSAQHVVEAAKKEAGRFKDTVSDVAKQEMEQNPAFPSGGMNGTQFGTTPGQNQQRPH